MTNQDKTYTSKNKSFIIQQPLTWGSIRDCLKEKFDIDEVDGKVIVEEKEDEK